jgi:hypothetical protein
VGERWRRSPSGKEEGRGGQNCLHDGTIVANQEPAVKAIHDATRRKLLMVLRWIRMVALLAVVAGLTVAVALRVRRPGPGASRERYGPLPTEDWPPVPVRPRPVADEAWVEPEGRVCPTSHPIKAKLSSGRFHLPGMAVYDRTIPDRCYATAEAAEVDGLQRAKR